MMLTIAECYQQDVYYLHESGNLEVIDEASEEAIRYKYNPEVNFSYY